MHWVDRAGGLAGIVAAVHLLYLPGCVCDLWIAGTSAPELTPDSLSATVAQAFAADAGRARVAAMFGLLAVFLVTVFFARLDGALRAAATPGAWTARLPLLGGMLLAVVLLVDAGLGFAASELSDYGTETEVLRFFVLWQWNSASLFAPAVALALLGTTVAAFTTTAFPPAYRWASLVLLVLLVLATPIGPGLALFPGTFWMFLTAGILVVRRPTAEVAPPAVVPAPA